jgi:hypothetical protein
MLVLALSVYLLLGVVVSNAQASVVSYAFALTVWPLLIVGLGLHGRAADTTSSRRIRTNARRRRSFFRIRTLKAFLRHAGH